MISPAATLESASKRSFQYDIDLVFTRYRPPHFRGGIERYVHVLAEGFRDRGYRTHVTTFAESLETNSGIPRTDVSVPRVPYLSTLIFALKTMRSWGRTGLVSLHYAHLGLSVPGDKLVVTVQTTSLGESRSLRATSSRSLMGRLRTFSRRVIGARVERIVFRKARRLIAINPHIAEEIVETCPQARDKIVVIGNGVDCEWFSPQRNEPRPANAPLRVLYVGRLEARKNVDLLLEAVSVAGVAAVIRIVGTGEQENRLRQLARGAGVAQQVEFRGFRTDKALLEEFRWADCFVMPSVYEGMPLAVLEARSCALPVISSPFEGSKGMIADGTGIVLSAPATEEMAAAIRWADGNRGELHRMGLRAREHVVAHYSWPSVLDRLAEAYELAPPAGVARRSEAFTGTPRSDRLQ